jgi:hypothetical protein
MSEKHNSAGDITEKTKSLRFWARMLCVIILNNLFYSSSVKILEFFVSSVLASAVVSLISIAIVFFYANNVFRFIDLLLTKSENIIQIPTSVKLLVICRFIYSSKTQKEIFEPIASDWQEEYFEALNKKVIWKARWINLRYTYAFLGAMWQKSPIGDLIELISKIAK